ncbi:MAG: folate family ECF transporter S component [Clostridia bacterium]|nr:folate family ECF transporter S component [Clostridia bacterium]
MSKSLFSTHKIAIMGMLTALSVVVNVFAIQVTPSNAINFVHTVTLIAGLTLGPYLAFIVGFLGSCIGFFISPMGAYNVFFDISAGLSGLIFGFAFVFYRKVIKNKSFIKLIIIMLIAYILVTIVCTAGINTVACYVLYSNGTKTFFVYLFGRLPFQLITTLINCITSSVLVVALNKIQLFNKIFNID